MANVFRIFGSELSPYSIKIRSYFRYKGIAHEWIVRNMNNMAEFQQHAKLPLIPLVLSPDGEAMQDSTPIIERMEGLFPEPSVHPTDPALAFASALIEEYGDEWGNKPMFHYRWFYEADQESCAERIVRENLPGAPEEQIRSTAETIRARMVPRLSFVGSSPATKDHIEDSFRRQLTILEQHLARRPYLFGGRPALADFGLYAQLYESSTDPTPSVIMAAAPNVLAWTQRMLDPKVEGEMESWTALEPTLLPLLRDEIAAVFLPWSTENARALAAGAKEFSCNLDGRPFTQQTQKYHAKSLAALRARYHAAADNAQLDSILDRAGCRQWLVRDD
jgi:glutathione S-transferase